ncbi:MAG: hypothetical protein IJX91_03710 [Clostridia bacterium]|nr:hypothetical protein [Clostridia bacterium]
MRAEEFISSLLEGCTDDGDVKRLKESIPLGHDSVGNIVYSQKRESPFTVRHTCVTGTRKTAFIKRLLITLACLYEKSEVNFLVLSPRTDYGELLRLQNADITVPYVNEKADLERAKACVRELIELQTREKGCPKLILVLDGLDEPTGCNKNGDLEEYRDFFELIARRTDVEIISGAELIKSIFSGHPGAFVGVGNCLVTTREEGKADVTYVNDDSSLSLPIPMSYPDAPSVTETVIWLNSLPAKAKAADE